MSFRVGIDGYNMALPRGTGVATYGRTLARAVRDGGHPLDLLFGLEISPKSRPEVRESLFYARLAEGDPAGRPPPRRTLRRTVARALTLPFARDMVPVPVTGRVVADDFADRLPPFDRLFSSPSLYTISARYFRRYKRFMPVRMADPPKVMHWTYPVPVVLQGAANVYTVHDLVPLRLPHTSLEDKRYYDALIGECVARADAICTVSEASRRDILELFPTDPARVVNTYQPVETPPPAPDADTLARRLRQLFDLPAGGYFLFFGAIEPKKNVGRLLEAYLSLATETPLVLVGAGGWGSGDALRLLGADNGKPLPSADRIRKVDYLPRTHLVELIRGARGVLFPSLYEGFGLPALEALALGAPLLTSNAASLPEVAGDAALTVDPYDVAAIAAGIARLDRDDGLRGRLAAAGPKRAGNFSGPRYATAIEHLYGLALDRAGVRV